jgi:hypothetical protein
MSNDVRRWRPWWQPEGLRVSEDCVGEYVLYGEHQSALAELREELADERLAFNHANEIAGKYEAENAALKSTLDHAKINWQACAKDSEMVRGLLDAERDTTEALKARLESIRTIGSQMSNVMFNLKQGAIKFADREREICAELQQEWDVATRAALPEMAKEPSK